MSASALPDKGLRSAAADPNEASKTLQIASVQPDKAPRNHRIGSSSALHRVVQTILRKSSALRSDARSTAQAYSQRHHNAHCVRPTHS